jgi:hypothetical protein
LSYWLRKTIILVMSRSAPSPSLSRHPDAVVIRPAYPDDAAALARLAALDSRRPLHGPVLIAERDGRPLAALATRDGHAVADPFAPTADLIALLRLHAADTAARPGRRQELLRRVGANPRRRPALARG